MSDFQSLLIDKIVSSLNNNYETMPDPWFANTLYKERQQIKQENFKDRFVVKRLGANYASNWAVKEALSAVMRQAKDLEHYAYLYELLEDVHSKNVLIDVVVYRLIGETKIKQSLESLGYEDIHKATNDCMIEKGSYAVDNFEEWPLNLYDLNPIGYNTKIHYTTMGIVTTFGVEQYDYKPVDVAPKPGAVILDCGGCWGDTALYFAAKAPGSKIFTFEFIPSNIALLEKNIEINNVDGIEIIPHPVWNVSDHTFFAVDKGPVSTISDQPQEGAMKITTLALDDFAKQKQLENVDFIKMDIEGAEVNALNGAKAIIQQHKPTLAIAVYHSPSDFSAIPKFIHELNLGYKFYLSHNTPHAAETVLFAIAK